MYQSIKEPAAPQRDPSASHNGLEMLAASGIAIFLIPVTFYVVERLSSRRHTAAQAPKPEPEGTPAAVVTP